MHYTAIVKHASSISLACTIVVAVIAGFYIAKQQRDARILRLLSSPTTTDQLAGIEAVQKASFDKLVSVCTPILQNNNDASIAAQNLLVARAFAENRLQELESVAISRELLDAASWWNTNPPLQHPTTIRSTPPLASSINHLSRFMELEEPPAFDDLIEMPIRDRDGSVLLAVLAIEKFATTEQLQQLVSTWSLDYDLERNKAAVLFAAFLDTKTTSSHTSNNELAGLRAVCNEKSHALAWRMMHYDDGTINPDIALAGMLANKDKFLPILIETAIENNWKHPEHPVVIAMRFAPNVANRIPTDLLRNDETRTKWWSLFACGLLLEGR